MENKPRALFVCSQVPSGAAKQAGHKTAFHYLIEFSKDNLVDLVVICKSNDMALDDCFYASCKPLTNKIIVVKLSNIERLISLVWGVLLGLAPRFSSRISLQLIFLFSKRGFKSKYQKVWLEFSQSFWISLLLDKNKEVIMSAHDVQTQVVSRKSWIEAILFLGWTYLSESRIFKNASTIRVQSAKDAEFIRNVLRGVYPVEISRPALSNFIYSVKRAEKSIEPYSILFWGAMNREENSTAIISFIKTNFASLKAEYPSLKLYIVGAGPTREIYALADKWSGSIVVSGFVENPSEYFEKCSLGIAPLISGAGVKVKVLEMLEAKIPVLSTPIGAEGIESNPLLHTAPFELFREKIKLFWN